MADIKLEKIDLDSHASYSFPLYFSVISLISSPNIVMWHLVLPVRVSTDLYIYPEEGCHCLSKGVPNWSSYKQKTTALISVGRGFQIGQHVSKKLQPLLVWQGFRKMQILCKILQIGKKKNQLNLGFQLTPPKKNTHTHTHLYLFSPTIVDPKVFHPWPWTHTDIHYPNVDSPDS